MHKYLTGNLINIKFTSTISLLLVCTPFFVLCFFVHPSFIDDYCFYTKTQEMGLFPAVLDWYNNWTGRYSLCFLMSVNPMLITSLLWYRITLFLMIAGIPSFFFLMIKTLFNQYSSTFRLSFTALFSFLFFFQLPSVNEGLYWMTAAIAYQMPLLCLLILIVLFYKICINKKNSYVYGFFASLLAIVLIGANEISMMTFDIFLICIILYRYISKASNNKVLWVILLISAIATFFVIYAPGNDVRGQLFPMRHNLMQAIEMTFLGLLYYLGQWLAMSLLVAIIALYVLKKTAISLPFFGTTIPFVYSLSMFGLVLLSGFIVPSWSTGQMPNPRAINILFFIFLLGLFYHIIAFHHLLVSYRVNDGVGKIAAFFTLFAIFFVTFYPGKGINNNIKTGYVDILSGKANAYDVEVNKLYHSEWQAGFSKKQMPLSFNWEYTKETYNGCPHIYFKTFSK